MDYTEMILLFGIDRLKGERTSSGLYHLLTGKKSSQTVQDGKLYRLSHLFGTFQGYTYATFQKKLRDIVQKRYVDFSGEQYPVLTSYGKQELTAMIARKPIPESINGWVFGKAGTVFWRRLTLYVQTLSHVTAGDRSFHPIQNEPEVQAWVKAVFPNNNHDRLKANQSLYVELRKILTELNEPTIENVLLRFSRFQRIGRTTRQIAENQQIDPMECHFGFLSAIHYMIKTVMENHSEFPVLTHFLRDLLSPYTLTNSTRQTFNLIQKGIPFETICAVRKLKPSTIEDHIVELAIHVPNFNITPYITREGQDEILQVARELQTRKLKEIKRVLEKPYTFFQIRLALSQRSLEGNESKGVKSIVH